MKASGSPSPSEAKLSDFAQRDRALWERVAADYCRKDLTSSSRIARRLRTRQTMSVVSLTEGDRRYMLEIGCGAGFAADYLDGMYGEYVGVDYSRELIELAQHRNRRPDAHFVVSDIKAYQPARQFDVVFAVGVLHHLDDIAATLGHVQKLIRPGGWLIANEPSPGNPLVSLARRVRKRLDSHYSDEQKELTARELTAAVEQAGFIDVVVKPQGLFSTPFAEVVIGPQWMTTPLSICACATDRVLEYSLGPLLSRMSWNLIVAGRRP